MPSGNVAWGLEVGAGAIKALKLERDGDQLRVADYVVLPHKKVLSTPDLNRDDAIAVALGAFMSQYRDELRGASVAVSVPGHSAFARFAKLPPVERKGVANLVKFEAVQQIPFPINDVEWDYQTFASDDSPEVEVGIFAMTKAKAAELLAQYGDQGLTPSVITLSPLAVYNAIAYDLSFTNATPGTVILDIGTTASDLIIADSGKVWIRTFPLGGHNFTEALAATFKLSYSKAEKLKREAETSKYKRHIFQAMKPVLQELVQDVQRSLTHYRGAHPESNISRVIVCGSTVRLLGLRKILSQQLQLEVYKLERFKRPQIDGAGAADFEAATPLLATAYGLALQGLGLQTINANLMPVPVIRRAVWKRKTPWFVAAAGIGLATGGLAFLRPALDSMAVAKMKADASITNPIRQTIALGTELKNEWQQASSAQQPGFVAQNLIRLTGGRELHAHLVKDLSDMFAAAHSAARSKSDMTLHPDRPLATLVNFDTQYLPPNTPLPVAAAGGATGGATGSATPDPAASDPALNQAGPAGAIRVSVTFDAPTDSRAFMNDSFLAWLRDSAQRPDAPYTLVRVPSASQLAPVEQQPPVGSTTKPGSGRPSSPAPTSPDGPDEAPTSAFGGAPSAASQPKAASPTSGAASDAELEKLAPLPARLKSAAGEGKTFRYTLTWFAQIRPPGAAPEAPPAGAADATSTESQS